MDDGALGAHDAADAADAAKAVRALSGRWTVPVLAALMGGPMRYSELSAATGAAGAQLSRALRQLRTCGLVVRVGHGASGYQLSAAAAGLGEPLRALAGWWLRQSKSGRPASLPPGDPAPGRACPVCAAVFAVPARQPSKRYCSAACRAAAWRERQSVPAYRTWRHRK
ncbi:MAG TPA: winged helix-turn-helix transcriptional regulator [Streptosporangiaceae bacterium]|nr:winged helix-turn-helix transcriptional regulator [Streptosporangiaceae bacterium]